MILVDEQMIFDLDWRTRDLEELTLLMIISHQTQ